jgi:hypothetical protein
MCFVSLRIVQNRLDAILTAPPVRIPAKSEKSPPRYPECNPKQADTLT